MSHGGMSSDGAAWAPINEKVQNTKVPVIGEESSGHEYTTDAHGNY